MLRQGLILTSHREYAQAMRTGLLSLGDESTRVDIELDAIRAMQLVPQQYDLILLDAMMSSMDGLQLLLLLKQQAPASKFVVVSDVPDEKSRAQAYQNGADFFLERPQTIDAVNLAVLGIKGLIKPRGDEHLRETEEDPLARLTDIVQTRCLSGDSVLLLVRSRELSGDVFIYRGEVYHAQYPGKSGETAFEDMVHWDDGLVRIKALKLNHVPPRTIETPYVELLDRVLKSPGSASEIRPSAGEFLMLADTLSAAPAVSDVILEAPPLEEVPVEEAPEPLPGPRFLSEGETELPKLNSHWKINLMGELVEGSQVAESDRCAFITYFIFRKLADVAVALEVDYFDNVMLFGPHLQQVLVADNLGVRHAVFETAWTTEADREQFVKWACEQSF
jgi:CheY-like chemotaxis protein